MAPPTRIRAGRAVRIAAVTLALAAARAVPAQAPEGGGASAAFAAATERFEAGDYRAAVELFEAALAAGADEPAALYNIGVSRYRLGEHDAAAAAFGRLAERSPELRAIAEYNLGLAELAAGRTENARAAFARAADGDDERIAALAAAMLERTADGETPPPAAAPRWTRYLELQAGRDDNVVLLEESSLPAGVSSASPFAEVLAVASGEPFAGVPFALYLSGYVVRYPDAGAFDQDAVRIGARYLGRAGAWRIEAGPHYDRSRLDGDGFEAQLGAGVTFARTLRLGLELELRVQHDRFDPLGAEFAYVDGTRDRLRVGVTHTTAQGRFRARYELERNDRAEPAVSADRDRLALGYEHYLGQDWTLELGAAYRASRYPLESREEDLFEIDLTASRQLGSGWLARAVLAWEDNDATALPLAYRRTRLGVGIARLF